MNKEILQTLDILVMRFMMIIFWMAPLIFYWAGAPGKYTFNLLLCFFFIFYSHLCQAIIYAGLITAKPWIRGFILLVIFGPLEIGRLKKIQQSSLPDF